MDKHVTQGSIALTLSSRVNQPYQEWLGVRLILAWYRDHLSATQLTPIWQRYQQLLQDIHSVPGHDPGYGPGRHIWPHGALDDPSLTRHLGHARAVSDVYYQQVASMLAELLELRSLILLIPNLAIIDQPSREVLLRLAQRGNGPGEMMVGTLKNIDQLTNGRIVRQGYIDPIQQREAIIRWLQSLEITQECPIIDLTESARKNRGVKPGLQGLRQAARRRGDWLEAALKRIQEKTPQDATSAVCSMWHWYRCYAYRNVLELAGGLSDRDLKALEPQELGIFHALVALAAYQLGVVNDELHQWVTLFSEQAAQALNELPRGALRCALLLRLAKLSGDYQDDFADAPDYCQMSQAESNRLQDLQGQYQQAWAALIHTRLQHQRPGATPATDLLAVQKSMRRLQSEFSSTPVDDASRRDLQLTRSALRISHAAMTAYQSSSSRCSGTTLDSLDYDGPHAASYEAQYWIDHHQQRREITAALSWSALFHHAGQQTMESCYALAGCLKLGQYYYQLGALRAASREFALWRAQQDKWRSRVLTGASQLTVQTHWVLMVLTEWRLGSTHIARALLQQQAQIMQGRDAGDRAVAASLTGLLEATDGNPSLATQAFKQAISDADHAYSISTFAQITQLIGQAYEAMGFEQKAVALYCNMLDNALKLERSRASDVFPVMVRLMALQDYNRGHVQYIFNHLPSILQTTENWWHLGDFLELIRHNEGAANFALFNHDVLAEMVWCASQRPDYVQIIRHFCQRLPEQAHERLRQEMYQRHAELTRRLPEGHGQEDTERILRHHANLLANCQTALGVEQPAA